MRLDDPLPLEIRLFRGLLGLLIFAAMLAFAAFKGWQYGSQNTSRECQATIATLKQKTAEDEAQVARLFVKRLVDETARANALAKNLAVEKASHLRTKETLKTRSSDVVKEYRPALDAAPQPVPRSIFTIGFLRHYNTAIGVHELPEPFATARAGITPDQSAAFDSLESGLTQKDILDHIANYGEWCKGIASQLNRLIDFQEGKPNAP